MLLLHVKNQYLSFVSLHSMSEDYACGKLHPSSEWTPRTPPGDVLRMQEPPQALGKHVTLQVGKAGKCFSEELKYPWGKPFPIWAIQASSHLSPCPNWLWIWGQKACGVRNSCRVPVVAPLEFEGTMWKCLYQNLIMAQSTYMGQFFYKINHLFICAVRVLSSKHNTNRIHWILICR